MREHLMQTDRRSRVARMGVWGVVLITLALFLVACSSPPAERRPRERRASASASADSGTSTAELLASFNEILEGSETQRRTFPSSVRDPFVRPVVTGEAAVSREQPGSDCNVDDSPLGMVPSPEVLSISGLITGVATPRVMFRLGSNDYIVTEGARIGPRCSWRVAEIRNNEIVLEPVGAEESEWRTRIMTWPTAEPEAEVVDLDQNDSDEDG